MRNDSLKKLAKKKRTPRRNLTRGDLRKHIKHIAIPASIGFFFQTMYNVVDTFYAGKLPGLGTEALAAMAISFPVFFMIIAIGSGISTGASVLISNALGAKNPREGKQYAAQAVSFGIIAALLLTVLGIWTSPLLFGLLGAEGVYLTIALSYINFIFLGTIFFLMTMVCNGMLIAIGDTKTFRNLLIVGFFLNLVLDPWFMFGGFGIPAMGIKGIALATVLIQAMQMVYMGYKVYHAGLIDRHIFRRWIPQRVCYMKLAHQGFPASLNMMTIALGIFIITYFLAQYSTNAVAAYGIVTRIEQIILLPTIGLNMAALAIVGQNNGAGNLQRIRETVKILLTYGMVLIGTGAVLMAATAPWLMRVFTSDQEVIAIGTTALYIASLISFTYVIMMIITSALQGMKRPMFAFYIGVYRQFLIPLLVFPLVVLTLPLVGMWWAIFLINWSATAITIWYYRRVLKNQSPNQSSA